MFIILLKFADKTRAPALMDAHKRWIAEGFEAGVFQMVGSLKPNAGGALLASGVSREEIEVRVAADPFVAEGVVSAEILEVEPGRLDARLDFLAA